MAKNQTPESTENTVSLKKGKAQRINLRDQKENKLIMLQKKVKK